MAFESLVEFETKKEALQILVDKGILTSHDFDVCVHALNKKATEKGIIYKDKYFSVAYKGFEEQQMLGGKGIKIYFIIENRTSELITVKARKSINEIIYEKEETISRDIPEKSKVIESTTLFYSNLKAAEINKIDDIESFSFLFWCLSAKGIEISRAKKKTDIIVK